MQSQNPEIQNQIPNFPKLLWYVASKGDLQNLKLFLESKLVDVDSIFNGVTPLWVAAQNGHTEIVEELIKNGANINFKSDCGESVLWTAASKGYARIVRLLSQQGALVNEISCNGSPFWVAVQNNHLDTVKELIKANADTNIVDLDGNTALHAACAKGHLQMTKLLIEAGANINAESLIGRTPISYAYAENRHQVVKYLLEHGALPDLGQNGIIDKFLKYLNFYSIIHPNECNEDTIQIIKHQLEQGLCSGFSKINRLMKDIGLGKKLKQQVDLISNWDDSFATLQTNTDLECAFHSLLFSVCFLHITDQLRSVPDVLINNQNVEINLSNYNEKVFQCGFVFKNNELQRLLDILLQKDVTINLSIVINNNLFHTVSLTKRNQALYEILDTNANVLKPIKAYSLSQAIKLLRLIMRTEENFLGLGLSIEMHSPTNEEKRKYQEIKNSFFDNLISLRASNNEIDIYDKNNLTSLFYAIYKNDIEMAKKLISKQATPDVGNEDVIPIYAATQIGSIELVNLLLKQSASADRRGKGGRTPLYLACENGFYEIAKALILKKADVNFNFYTGYTPLMAAISNGHSALVDLLINYGDADINHKAFFTTPISLAIENGFLDIVKILVNAGVSLSNVYEKQSAIEFAKEKKQDVIANYLAHLNDRSVKASEEITTPQAYAGTKNPSSFFKPNSKEGQYIIKTRHASTRSQKEYDENYGIIPLNKSM